MLKRGNQKPNQRSTSEPFTYIHRGTVVEGTITAKGRVRVHGTVNGNLDVHGVLEVAEGGVIEGERIRADEVKIIGSVRANIEAKGKIEIWQKGKLEGDVQAAALDIEEGASFTGRSEMRPKGKVVSAPLPAATRKKETGLKPEKA